MKVRILFVGTGDFAVPILEKLHSLDYIELVGIITQPDKPVGRKQELTPGPLKQAILNGPNSAQLKIYQPGKLRLEAEQILNETQPDLIIVAAYGQMIPDIMLTQPKYKCLNLHGSLLPELRGAVPVPIAILQGLDKTGITIQQMVKELDAGPIIAVKEVELEGNETTEVLMSRLAALSCDLLAQILPDWVAGKIIPQPQDESKATFCYQEDIAKEKAEIKFETDVNLAERMVRAFYPWPVAWITYKGKRVKIFKTAKTEGDWSFEADELTLKVDGGRLYLCLQNGTLEILELQLEGSMRREAKDYLYLVGNND